MLAIHASLHTGMKPDLEKAPAMGIQLLRLDPVKKPL